ncbi:related to cysteine synthase [Melanopsichium pennsylvanicum]|uniref:cysteine synthase n=2 Tax=Melanopsichium pennsylvanicum TaxID=63383 RepID=A0AAJ4XNL1_9BASI|nr:related to cysteine synthase [Melanopsichium pennsylvanicum 4]SNX85428.1 related to cysteine synthase [Melanopsichium pennsylvanicum]
MSSLIGSTYSSVASASSSKFAHIPGWSFITRYSRSHRKSTFLIGVFTGLVLGLGSITSVFFLAERRERKRRRRKLRSYGMDDDDEQERRRRELRGRDPIQIRSGQVVRGVEGLIGNTPLMRINSLSDATGCEILGKAEFLNPAGSPKDRVALQILKDAEEEGLLYPNTGSCIFEGTVGSTGISLATLARAKGYRCSIVIPDDVAREKVELLEKLGAEIQCVRPRGIVDPRHFVNEARACAEAFGDIELVGPHPTGFGTSGYAGSEAGQGEEYVHRQDLVVSTKRSCSPQSNDAVVVNESQARGFFADQFENPSNFWAHYNGTGPEIWRQTGGLMDAFVAGAGTGGTLSGCAAYLKRVSCDPDESSQGGGFIRRPGSASEVRIILADPQGSGLYNKVKYGVMYSPTEAEGKRRRHQVDSVVEGIGINRVTRNLQMGLQCIDDAERVSDDEAARMGRYLILNDGLFLGSSSAVNCVAAVRTALKLKKERGDDPPPVVVTVLCDSGSRHVSKFHSDDALARLGVPDAGNSDISDILNDYVE